RFERGQQPLVVGKVALAAFRRTGVEKLDAIRRRTSIRPVRLPERTRRLERQEAERQRIIAPDELSRLGQGVLTRMPREGRKDEVGVREHGREPDRLVVRMSHDYKPVHRVALTRRSTLSLG